MDVHEQRQRPGLGRLYVVVVVRVGDWCPLLVRLILLTPNYDHHVEPAEARSLPLFMDVHLKGTGGPWPATPRIEIGARDGVPVVR